MFSAERGETSGPKRVKRIATIQNVWSDRFARKDTATDKGRISTEPNAKAPPFSQSAENSSVYVCTDPKWYIIVLGNPVSVPIAAWAEASTRKNPKDLGYNGLPATNQLRKYQLPPTRIAIRMTQAK